MALDKKKLTTPMEILAAALQKEKNSYAFYNDLLQEATVEFVVHLLTELRDSEYNHLKKIEGIITHLQQS